MLRSSSARHGGIFVLLLCAAVLAGCNDHEKPTPEQIAEFKYCSGFTAALERAAYRRLIDLETTGNLRAGQKQAGSRLLLPPEEMGLGAATADAQGNTQASTATEVGRGLEEGTAMIDQNRQVELSGTIGRCNELFATLVR